jgi:Peptidase family M28
VDLVAEIEELVRFRGRGAGTDAERRAARHLRDRLTEGGRDAEIQPIEVRPAYAVAHALIVLAALVASLVSVAVPIAGLALALVAAAAVVGDASGRAPLVRRLTGRRASQNVVSRAGGDRPGTLILVAHYDAGRGGAVYTHRLADRIPGGPLPYVLGSIVLVAVSAGLRVAGLEGTAVSVVQFIPTVALILALPLLVDIALTAVVPGASDNASGVAAVLALAGDLGEGLEHFDVWVLLTGAQEGGALGMAQWMRRERKSLAPERTVVVNVDEVGAGDVRFAAREGLLFGRRAHPQLLQLCRDIAADDRVGAFNAAPVTVRARTDALPPRSRGVPSITITTRPSPEHHRESDTPENVDEGSVDRTVGFTRELAERLDSEIGPELAAG